jgi:hypothetical protein
MKKIGIKTISLAISFLLMISSATLLVADDYEPADDPIYFSAIPSAYDVQVGETFTIGIWVDPNGQAIDSVQTNLLYWDPGYIELKSVVIEDFIPLYWDEGDEEWKPTTQTKLGATTYIALPPATNILAGATRSWNYSLPFFLDECDGALTYVRAMSGTYSLRINGHEVANVTAAPATNYDLDYWVAQGASINTEYIDVSITNRGGSSMSPPRLYMLDSYKTILAYSTQEAATRTTSAYLANLTFEAFAMGSVNFSIGGGYPEYKAVLASVDYTNYIISNCTVNITYGSAPIVSNPNPSNGLTGVDKNLASLSVTLTDPDGDTMNYSIECSNGDSYSGARGNGTASLTLTTLPLAFDTEYTWWVNVTDGYNPVNHTFTFTVRSQYQPNAPTGFVANGISTSQIKLDWSKGSNATLTYIMAKQGGYPADRNDGLEIFNATGTTVTHGSLGMGETWYYKAWCYNTADKTWSLNNATATGTTLTNQAPTFGTPSPTNGSMVATVISFTWQISITDPEVDLFDWTIECSNGQNSGATGVSGGTKSLLINQLDFDTEYTVWVNATDVGSSEWTRKWFTFETISLEPPSGFSAVADGRFTINLSWTMADYSDKILVRGKLGSYPSDETDGTLLHNGTATGLSHINLNSNEHWYYRAWSWNETKGVYSDPVSVNETTDENQLPVVVVRPGDGTNGVTLSPDIEIEYEDADGDIMLLVVAVAEKDIPDPMDNLLWVGLIIDEDEEYKFSWLGCKTPQELEDYADYLETIEDISELEIPYFGCANMVDILNESTDYTIWVKAIDQYDGEINYTFNFTTGATLNITIDLIYLNETVGNATGYNFITVLNSTISASVLGQFMIDENISWDYITFFDEALQKYSTKIIQNDAGIMYGFDFTVYAGSVVLIHVLESKLSINYSGFNPTMPWEDIELVEGFNWLGRTGESTSAFHLGENLTTYAVNWSSIYYYDATEQGWSDERFALGDGEGDPWNFAITTGMAVLVEINESGTFRMGGW